MIITKDYLMKYKTDRGAWTKSQFEALGLELNDKFTPDKGWMDRVIGTYITYENALLFQNRLTAKEVKKLRKKTKKAKKRHDKRRVLEESNLERIKKYKAEFGLNVVPTLPKRPRSPNAKKLKKSKKVKEKVDFYRSKAWRDLRYKALKLYGRQCMCCGAKPPSVVLHVDHIKPRSKYPELELDITNLQILCEDCNLGKSNKDEIDYR